MTEPGAGGRRPLSWWRRPGVIGPLLLLAVFVVDQQDGEIFPSWLYAILFVSFVPAFWRAISGQRD